jgi:hypothetical protein
VQAVIGIVFVLVKVSIGLAFLVDHFVYIAVNKVVVVLYGKAVIVIRRQRVYAFVFLHYCFYIAMLVVAVMRGILVSNITRVSYILVGNTGYAVA